MHCFAGNAVTGSAVSVLKGNLTSQQCDSSAAKVVMCMLLDASAAGSAAGAESGTAAVSCQLPAWCFTKRQVIIVRRGRRGNVQGAMLLLLGLCRFKSPLASTPSAPKRLSVNSTTDKSLWWRRVCYNSTCIAPCPAITVFKHWVGLGRFPVSSTAARQGASRAAAISLQTSRPKLIACLGERGRLPTPITWAAWALRHVLI
jgi:hypothetical protein